MRSSSDFLICLFEGLFTDITLGAKSSRGIYSLERLVYFGVAGFLVPVFLVILAARSLVSLVGNSLVYLDVTSVS